MARKAFDAQTVEALNSITTPETVQQAMRIIDRVVLVEEDEQDGEQFFGMMLVNTEDVQMISVGRFPTGELSSTCSCEKQLCVHQVAAILSLSQSHGLRLTDGARGEDSAPRWQDVLNSVLPEVAGADDAGYGPENGSHFHEICLFFQCVDGEVSIRPGEKGKTGNWIKGKAGWRNIHALDLAPRVADIIDEFRDLNMEADLLGHGGFGGFGGYGGYGYGGYREAEWLALTGLKAGGVWEKLVTLRDAGVELVTWKGRNPVELDPERARIRMAVTGQPESSDLSLSAELLYDDCVADDSPAVTHYFLGEPPDVVAEARIHGASQEFIRLRRLVDGASADALALLNRAESLHVAAQDREEFERDFLPRIRGLMEVESPDDSYTPPESVPPVLVLEVNPIVDGEDNLVRVRLQWRWERSGGVRDPDHEDAVVASVQQLGVTPVEQTLPREQAVPFLAETLHEIDDLEYVRTTVTAEVPQFRPAQDAPSVSIGTDEASTDWLDLFVTVAIGGEEVNFVELFTALNRDEEIFVLTSGTYFRLDTPELDQLHRIIDEAKTLNDVTVDGLKISKYQVDVWAELVESGIVDAQSNRWWSQVNALADNPDGSSDLDSRDIPVPDGLRADLRDYQVHGYRWLDTLRCNGLGGILADDMGLGKTLQVIAMMLSAVEEADARGSPSAPFLVVAPTSVVGNWVREVQKFAPELTAVGIDRTEKKLGRTVAEEIAAAAEGGAHVVVTSYTLFRLDAASYASVDWAGAVFDEAQMIKNHASQAYTCARRLDAPLKIAVTGTPLENNLLELWTLVSLVCPGLLGSKTHFEEFYRNPVEKDGDSDRLSLLQRRLRPFLLRRTKEKVAADLPEKTENVLELDLYPKHRKIYDRRLQRERQKLLGLVDDMNANRFEVFRTLTLLRQLALDSELGGEAPSPSAKLDALADLLSNATQEGHRVLVLSQFTRFLSKARDAATDAGIDSLYLDGKTRDRQKLIDSFSAGDGAPVFFISLKAGGFGLNLTEADYVVLLDPWWNPATEAQAVDRAHRIGQTRSVMVYRLVSADTIESKVMDLKTSKAALFDRVLDGGGTVESDGLSVDDIRALVE
ncbi:DEAD/DEAH box helicase [Corynebacterium sp.]|uniref:DEAD/DEAH box helicase n=1 Tax=Corynebacterium sp. TaxID=1720 RepID=UPI0028AB3E1D|nr:DEAD/DEAH box helicase [Corynebacterium sp.]